MPGLIHEADLGELLQYRSGHQAMGSGIGAEVNAKDPASDLEKTQTENQSEQQYADSNQPVSEGIPRFTFHGAHFQRLTGAQTSETREE